MSDELLKIEAVARHRDKHLFLSFAVPSVMHTIERQMVDQLDQLSDARVLAEDPGDLAEALAAPWRVQIPVLLEDQIEVSRPPRAEHSVFELPRRAHEEQGSEKGPTIEVRVPFDGHEGVFGWADDAIDFPTPVAQIRHSQLIFTYTFERDDQGNVAEQLQGDLTTVKRCLALIAERALPFNATLAPKALERIEERRARLRRDREMIASLGYPLRRREDAPETYCVPMKRRVPIPRREGAGKRPEALEPAVAMAEYEHILNVISQMALVLERSPKAFRTLDEEDLRTHFLVQLNGHYHGQATGETFNFEGKTDILVRVDDRNVFVGECKFWRGPAVLNETVDQLLGYLTWRDAKAAIVVFNQNRNFTQVLEKIPEVLESHPNYLRTIAYPMESGFRYLLRHRDDPEREITVTVLAFDVPV